MGGIFERHLLKRGRSCLKRSKLTTLGLTSEENEDFLANNQPVIQPAVDIACIERCRVVRAISNSQPFKRVEYLAMELLQNGASLSSSNGTACTVHSKPGSLFCLQPSSLHSKLEATRWRLVVAPLNACYR
jgi:hypothetical protein